MHPPPVRELLRRTVGFPARAAIARGARAAHWLASRPPAAVVQPRLAGALLRDAPDVWPLAPPHLAIANRRRNAQASHATFYGFDPKPVAEVRARLDSEVKELGQELIHLLQHIGQIENRMREELEYALSVGMLDPWWKPV